MSLPDDPIRDERLLTRYLLGDLPQEESERLDELSIADGDFCYRLNAAEDDLVDSYVKGELDSKSMERFCTVYLSSPKRREKVRFAKTLAAVAERQDSTAPPRSFTTPLVIPRWAFGSLAAAALLALGLLTLDDVRLRSRVDQARSENAVLAQRERELKGEIEGANRAPAVNTVALLLLPPRRGVEQIPELAIPQGTENAAIDLQLEADDFPAYRVALRRSSSRDELWKSAELKPHPGGARNSVSILLAVGLLQPGNYTLELSSAGPNPEPLANYPFRVIFK